MTSALTIRAAVTGDLEALCGARNTPELYRRYFAECDGDGTHFLVAQIGERIVGFGLVYLTKPKAGKPKSHLPKLSDLYVIEPYRRHGIATALVRQRETLARQYGYSTLYVSIDPAESAGMLALAKKLGYVPMQEAPYPVTATFYDTNAQPYTKQYFRLDLSKQLI